MVLSAIQLFERIRLPYSAEAMYCLADCAHTLENGGLLRNQALDQEKYGQYILLRECLHPRLFMHLFRARFSYKLH